jgi:hypothetical protein
MFSARRKVCNTHARMLKQLQINNVVSAAKRTHYGINMTILSGKQE